MCGIGVLEKSRVYGSYVSKYCDTKSVVLEADCLSPMTHDDIEPDELVLVLELAIRANTFLHLAKADVWKPFSWFNRRGMRLRKVWVRRGQNLQPVRMLTSQPFSIFE